MVSRRISTNVRFDCGTICGWDSGRCRISVRHSWECFSEQLLSLAKESSRNLEPVNPMRNPISLFSSSFLARTLRWLSSRCRVLLVWTAFHFQSPDTLSNVIMAFHAARWCRFQMFEFVPRFWFWSRNFAFWVKLLVSREEDESRRDQTVQMTILFWRKCMY